MDEHLEHSWRSVYYQVSEEAGITGCICQLGGVDVRTCLLIDHCRVIFFLHVKFLWLVSTEKLF